MEYKNSASNCLSWLASTCVHTLTHGTAVIAISIERTAKTPGMKYVSND